MFSTVELHNSVMNTAVETLKFAKIPVTPMNQYSMLKARHQSLGETTDPAGNQLRDALCIAQFSLLRTMKKTHA